MDGPLCLDNSNAIEGSTLTLEDTELGVGGEFVTDSPARYIFAARGVADGMAYAERFAEEERTLSVEMIQKLYEVTALDMQPALRVSPAPTATSKDHRHPSEDRRPT